MTGQRDFSLLVAFGTDMGNSEDAAMTFAEGAAAAGIAAEAIELNQVDYADLRAATHFVVVCSTFGDGEFPDNALLFWEALSAADARRLEHLSFAVLALGDTSYDLFCNAGKLIDERLDNFCQVGQWCTFSDQAQFHCASTIYQRAGEQKSFGFFNSHSISPHGS